MGREERRGMGREGRDRERGKGERGDTEIEEGTEGSEGGREIWRQEERR